VIASHRPQQTTSFHFRNRSVPDLHASVCRLLISHVTRPQRNTDGEFFARAELADCPGDLKSLLLSGDTIRRYFYELDREEDLYKRLGTSETATPGELRVAWRLKELEIGESPAQRVAVERAFNILAHPELRKCYDLLRRTDDTPALFPYAGKGSILVEGRLSNKGEVFFADRILAYKPELRRQGVSLLLRQCEFLTDLIVCRDARRKLEVWLDRNLVPGLNWDLTWNHWKHWLKSRIQIDATFVHSAIGSPIASERWIALPSRLRVAVPDDIAEDIRQARTIHALLGEHAGLIERIRAESQKQPIEHVKIQEWFDRLGASIFLKPQHLTWQADYDPHYFEELRKRAATWFLFRDEYLFICEKVLISEIPRTGHATYVFAKPWDVAAFMLDFRSATRADIRANRNNVATRLGFVGRVLRGRNRKRWLRDLLVLAGDESKQLEVVE
jgi:hypothetical protein